MSKEKEETKTPQELTLLQKIAIEGEVSSQYDSCVHEADKVFKTYLTLKCACKELFPYYYAECAKYMDQEILDSCMAYINKGVFPTTYLTNRFISDIKICLRKEESCGYYQAPPTSEAVLKSRYVSFVTSFIEVSPKLAEEFLSEILVSDEPYLDFLKDVTFLIKENLEVDEKEDLEKINLLALLALLQSSVMSSDLLSFSEEMDKTDGNVQGKEDFIGMSLLSLGATMEEQEKEGLSEEEINQKATETLKDIKNTNNILFGKPSEETKTYQVNKIDKSTGRTMQLKEFTSQTEAINFVKEINNDYPELSQRYKFTITIGSNKG